jgi:hypothetical protein
MVAFVFHTTFLAFSLLAHLEGFVWAFVFCLQSFLLTLFCAFFGEIPFVTVHSCNPISGNCQFEVFVIFLQFSISRFL